MEEMSIPEGQKTSYGRPANAGQTVKTSHLAIASLVLSTIAVVAYLAGIVLAILYPAPTGWRSPLLGPAGGLIMLLSFFILLAPAGYFTGRRALRKIKASDGTLRGHMIAKIGTVAGGAFSILMVLMVVIPIALRGGSKDTGDSFQQTRSRIEGFFKAQAAYEKGDYTEAVLLLEPLAEGGVIAAQVNLGIMYAEGRGVARDDTEAVRWFRSAAEKENSEAQSRLGAMYLTGRGVAPDSVEAVRWFRMAAEQGHPYGQNNLGKMYALGEGVDRDEAEALRWWLKSAKQGNELGQYNLAEMYAGGRGVATDIPVAVEWYFKAGNSFLKLGHRDYAETCLDAIRKYEPESELGKKLEEAIHSARAE